MSEEKKMEKVIPRGRRSALVIVDVQNDFCPPNGSLAVPEGTKVINTINELQASVKWEVVAYTQDWHPEDHVSFYSNHKDNPNAVLFHPLAVEDGSMQIMWPDHCIEESKGAAFHSNLVVDEEEGFFVRKGTDKNVENYSGFGPKNASGSTSQLTEKLRQEGITDVYVAGLAYDYCVGSTALDAAKEGFHTYVVIDGTRSVSPSTEEVMKERLRQAGVLSIHSSSIIEQRPNRKADVTEYLAKHKVNELFENLCTLLVVEKPENPRQFLAETLEKEIKLRDSGEKRYKKKIDLTDVSNEITIIPPK